MKATSRERYRASLARWLRPVRAFVGTRGGPAAFSHVVGAMRGRRFPIGAPEEHLRAAMDWLRAAQDATGVGGVSAYYDLARGEWVPAYPETTGYIVETFFDYAARVGRNDDRDRAIRMADWLLGLQFGDGSFPIGPLWPHWERQPIVFDTGQILHGLVRALEETGNEAYREAGRQAGDWLARVQEPDGSWVRYAYLTTPHTYSSRVSWALLRLNQVCPTSSYREAGYRQLAWTAAQQQSDGWFQNAAFSPDQDPLTHTIAYTIRGLLEGGLLLGDERLVGAARRAADALKDRQLCDGSLRGTYGSGWVSRVTWTCLTGNVQMAQIWLRLYELTADRSYFDAAVAANRFVMATQPRRTGLSWIDGGIAGSYPIQGDYQSFQIVNWAAKFFVDSLLLEEALRVRRANVHRAGPAGGASDSAAHCRVSSMEGVSVIGGGER